MRTIPAVFLSFLLAIAASAAAQSRLDAPGITSVYHEATCPSVDPTRMSRMKRIVAETTGILPAPDCHPDVRVRYLGEICPPSYDVSVPVQRQIRVSSYTRGDGTFVPEYWR
ncbi:MAG: hypothetical protein QOH21_3380, partial [Acidobacteriota bacterium]|nr:hypothetical protein [Acidobacteriota bacterium]